MLNQKIKKMGLEDEYLLTDEKGNIPSNEKVDELLESLAKLGWAKEDGKHIYHKDGFIIMQDSGYSLVEFITPAYEINDYHRLLLERRRVTQEVFNHFYNKGFLLTSSAPAKKIPANKINSYVTRKSRAQAFIEIMPKTEYYRFFGPATHFNLSFYQEKDLVSAMNIMNCLSGLFLLLSARQKLWLGEDSGKQSMREYSWLLNCQENPSFGERTNFLPVWIENVQQYVDLVSDKKVLFFDQAEKLIMPKEDLSFRELKEKPQLVSDKFTQEKVTAQLSDKDLNYFLKSIWYNTRLKNYSGEWVLELRIFDTQRLDISEDLCDLVMAVLARANDFSAFVEAKGLAFWQSFYWQALNDGLDNGNSEVLAEFLAYCKKLEIKIPEFALKIQKSKKTQADYIAELYSNKNQSRLPKELVVLDYFPNYSWSLTSLVVRKIKKSLVTIQNALAGIGSQTAPIDESR